MTKSKLGRPALARFTDQLRGPRSRPALAEKWKRHGNGASHDLLERVQTTKTDRQALGQLLDQPMRLLHAVYRWRERKRLPADKIGRLWKCQLSEVAEWVRVGGAGEENGEGGARET